MPHTSERVEASKMFTAKPPVTMAPVLSPAAFETDWSWAISSALPPSCGGTSYCTSAGILSCTYKDVVDLSALKSGLAASSALTFKVSKFALPLAEM